LGDVEAAAYWLWWINAAKITGAGLVAIGVAAEFFGEFAAKPFEQIIEAARQSETLQLTNETARLSAEADSAKAAIAGANARAAEAQLALEKLKTPRSLSRFQTIVLADKLRPFAKTRFDLSVIIGDPEAIGFLGFIADVLEAAGWEWIEYNHPAGPFMNVYNIPGKSNIGQQGLAGRKYPGF
jgi:hypothetical protein